MFNLLAFRASSMGLGCRGLQVSSLLSSAKFSAGLNHAPLSNYAMKGLTTSCAQNAQSAPAEDFFEKNKKLNRPMSPHLTIYKLQMTSALSLTHRATGLMMSGLVSGFAIGTLLLPSAFPVYITMLQASHYGQGLIFMAKFTLAFPLMFHLLNGIRHLAWDMGKGFELKTLYATGYGVIGSSIVLGMLAALWC